MGKIPLTEPPVAARNPQAKQSGLGTEVPGRLTSHQGR
jgi:hypothetical protein